MSDDVKIHGLKSIRVRIKHQALEGLIYLDPAFGSYDHVSEIDIPSGEIVRFYCPQCGMDLSADGERCPSCTAPTFSFDLPGEGRITGCLRKGCFEHTLKIHSLDQMQVEIDDGFIRVIM